MCIMSQADLQDIPAPDFVWWKHSRNPPGLKQILRVVENRFGLGRMDLCGHQQNADVVKPRHIAFWLARKTTGYSYPMISRVFKMNHTSIMYGVKQVENMRERNAKYRELTDGLLRELGG